MLAHKEQVELPLATESNTVTGVQNYDYELVEFAIDAKEGIWTMMCYQMGLAKVLTILKSQNLDVSHFLRTFAPAKWEQAQFHRRNIHKIGQPVIRHEMSALLGRVQLWEFFDLLNSIKSRLRVAPTEQHIATVVK